MDLSFVIALAFAVLVGALVAVAIFLARRSRAGMPVQVSLQTVMAGYFHLARGDDDLVTFLNKLFVVIPLIVYSLVGMLSLVMAIFQLTSFYLTPAHGLAYQAAPGPTVATPIVFVPLWLYYLVRIFRTTEREAPAGRLAHTPVV